MAKNTLDAGDFGYGLIYGGIGAGLVLGSIWSSTIVDRIGIARAYSGALCMMALGFGVGAASPNIWFAAACCVVGGVGNGIAVVCNALLVQRGAPDALRGRVFAMLMSTNVAFVTAGMVVAGWLTDMVGARWILAAAGAFAGTAGVVGFALARRASAQEPAREPLAVSGPV